MAIDKGEVGNMQIKRIGSEPSGKGPDDYRKGAG
jgi:hypothetical protein